MADERLETHVRYNMITIITCLSLCLVITTKPGVKDCTVT